MKAQNRPRSHKQNILLLEQALSLKDRLFSMIALKRGLKRLKRWAFTLLWLLPLLAGIGYICSYAIEQAGNLAIEKVSYKSRHGMIDKEQVMSMLGLSGSVNLATFDAAATQARLEREPAIQAAHIRAELPDTLHVEIEERIPIAYVESENAASTGKDTRLFVDPTGFLFPINEEYHSFYLGVPVWYLHPGDFKKLEAGEKLDNAVCRPIRELVAAANKYDPTEIPPIREIFRPKEWQILLTLENGTEVVMMVYNLDEQMERLAMVLEHARATGRSIRSANVIPRLNPVVVYEKDKTE